MPSIIGTNGNDVLFDTSDDDVISGGGGNDLIYALHGGFDTVDAGEGDDVVHFRTTPEQLDPWGYGGFGVSGSGGFDTLYIDFSSAYYEISFYGSATSYPTWRVEGFERFYVTGSASSDVLAAGDSDDTLVGGGGNDLLQGLGGSDTAGYYGLYRQYQVNMLGSQGLVTGGPEGGTDSLSSIERVAFRDGVLTSNVDGIAAQVTRLYKAALLRTPEPAGLDLWTDAIEDYGATLKQVANKFLSSSEFKTLTGQMSDADYVSFLYRGALGRAPDADGWNYWISKLTTQSMDRADVLLGFSESAEHRKLTDELVNHGYFYTNDSYQALALLYDSFAGRLPDAGGLTYWADKLISGQLSLEAVSESFAASAEFQSLTAGMSNSQLVSFMYQNTYNRAVNSDDLAWWAAQLDSGRMDPGDILQSFSQSEEHFYLLGNQITDGINFIAP